MKIKKMIALVMACMVAFASFTACSKNQTEETTLAPSDTSITTEATTVPVEIDDEGNVISDFSYYQDESIRTKAEEAFANGYEIVSLVSEEEPIEGLVEGFMSYGLVDETAVVTMEALFDSKDSAIACVDGIIGTNSGEQTIDTTENDDGSTTYAVVDGIDGSTLDAVITSDGYVTLTIIYQNGTVIVVDETAAETEETEATEIIDESETETNIEETVEEE